MGMDTKFKDMLGLNAGAYAPSEAELPTLTTREIGNGTVAAPTQTWTLLDKRELTDVDLEFINSVGTGEKRSLAKIKAHHHEIARLVAAGHKNVDVARITGYHPATIGNLLQTPAFNDLVHHYNELRTDEQMRLDTQVQMAASEALAELREKIMSGELQGPALAKATMDLLDRAGESPVAKSQTLSVSMTGDQLAQLKNTALQNEPIIELKAEKVNGDE